MIGRVRVTALRFNLNPNTNLNLKAGTLLLSYRSLHLTAQTDKPHADTLMSRQVSHRPALRTDKPRTVLPCEPDNLLVPIRL